MPIADIRNIEINDQFQQALDLMENGKESVFITGKAGTGKSTLLEYFQITTGRTVVLLAPTGVAAVNIGGQTIHSFFKFKPNITVEAARKAAGKVLKRDGRDLELYQKTGTIIIDEVSMVRADLLDCIDAFLKVVHRNKGEAFGGAKMVFIGDLYQLPPVVTTAEREIFAHHYESPYFFSAKVFAEMKMTMIELEKIYRQKDEKFISVLNSIRNNSVKEDEIAVINSRFDPDFEPKDDFYVYLTPINARAAEINQEKLSQIKGKLRSFQAEIEGEFEKSAMPAEQDLMLKVGSQVMLLNNDSMGRWYNGTIGNVVEIGEEEIYVKLPNGDVEAVMPFKWEMFKYGLDEKTGAIKAEEAGAFKQFPIKLAWAITIHKSQGKTFDRVILDLSRGLFATGQAYVALSRCRTLEGIVLKHKFRKQHVLVDWKIVRFITQFQYNKSNEAIPLEEKFEILQSAISSRKKLKITYLKGDDVKSRRIIEPISVGKMEFAGKAFPGVKCFCHTRKEERTFRVDRILEMEEV